jgi:ribosomal protein S18 acetylase RimI-like enzyme
MDTTYAAGWPMTLSVVQRSPEECSVSELDAFEHLVKIGGEVNPSGLRGRIESTYSVAWLQDTGGTPVGVGALKKPNGNYRSTVFQKTGSSEEPGKYEAELGWVFLKTEFRGQGLSTALMKELLSAAGGKAIYATARKNNKTMRAILTKFGFVQEGKDYPSDEGNYRLVLYIKKA